MKIEIKETKGTKMENSALHQIVGYDDAGKMLLDCVAGKIFLGNYVSVKVGNNPTQDVFCAGQKTEYAESIINEIGKLPNDVIRFSNDDIEIKINDLKKEFFIWLK